MKTGGIGGQLALRGRTKRARKKKGQSLAVYRECGRHSGDQDRAVGRVAWVVPAGAAVRGQRTKNFLGKCQIHNRKARNGEQRCLGVKKGVGNDHRSQRVAPGEQGDGKAWADAGGRQADPFLVEGKMNWQRSDESSTEARPACVNARRRGYSEVKQLCESMFSMSPGTGRGATF